MEGIRLETAVSEKGGYKILDLAGEIDVYTAPQFKEAMIKLLDTGIDHLFVDMSKVRYMDSSGFGVVLSAVKRLRPKNGTVNLVGCAGSIDRVLRITKLDAIFDMHATMEDAFASVKQKSQEN